MINELEHAAIRVADIDKTIEFLTTALPNLRVRGGGGAGAMRWVHIGTDDTYIALTEDRRRMRMKGPGLTHLGFVVDDWEAVRRRLEAAGYAEGNKDDGHPHRKRIYYIDANGLEWEFVEYFSDDPAERNDYSR
jgi:catechol 2,3-dioxygenase-like lactoylglutathione lyase family enzyme